MNLFNCLVLLSCNIKLVLSVLFSDNSSLPFTKECEINVCVFQCMLSLLPNYDDSESSLESTEKSPLEAFTFDKVLLYNNRKEPIINKTINIILTNATEVLGESYYIYNGNMTWLYPDNKFYLHENLKKEELKKMAIKLNAKECDGALEIETPNIYNRFTHFKKYNFCIDYIYMKDSNKLELIWIAHTVPKQQEQDLRFTASTLILSAVFLGLVALVYVLLPTRTISKFIVLGYTSSQFCGFTALAIMQIANYVKPQNEVLCKPFSIVLYFFFMSSFLWLNVMSYDIWWSIKSLRLSVCFSKKTLFKYSAYTYGLSIGISTAVAIIDNTDLTDYPYIIKPNFGRDDCFFIDGERFLYLYIPLIIILIINAIFFIMTALIDRRVSILLSKQNDSRSSKKQSNRYLMYIKLSVVMGFNWALEFTSMIEQERTLWMIVDFFNTIITGLAVFIVFVCNRETIKELSKRFPSLKRFVPKRFYASERTKTESQKQFIENSVKSLHHEKTTDTKVL